MKLILASNNRHKIAEVREVLGELGFEVVPMSECGYGGLDIEENGTSFEDNSLIKAKYLFRLTGQAVLADDSGLEVDALGGAPGYNSARYAGVHGDDRRNNELLLRNLQPYTDLSERSARFCCVITLILPSPHSGGSGESTTITARGDLPGYIGFGERGANGFGYDPLFILAEDMEHTMAELSEQEKNAVSHRARALRTLVYKMRERGFGNTGAS